MAPLPPNNTDRFKVFYTNAGHQHVMDVRCADSDVDFAAQMDAFLTALSPKMLATTIDQVQLSLAGNNFFLPVATDLDGNTYGSGAGNAGSAASFISFGGRSSVARRVKITVFGVNDTGTDWRFSPGEDSAVDAAIAALQDFDNHFTAIDGSGVTWKNYANAGYNAYWQRQLRP
jgi:hypothetical protein